jgi:tetratricopeptide (TPR) repeat protein
VEIAEQEIPNLTGNDLFFAWYNKGTGFSALTDYGQSAVAYDYALGTVYESLPDDGNRPYRIFWYQTGPYKAYFYTSEYDKVIQIADAAISTTYDPIGLEETLYYRALAEAALGLYDAAYADIRQSVYYNRHFQLALDVMAQWGLTP